MRAIIPFLICVCVHAAAAPSAKAHNLGDWRVKREQAVAVLRAQPRGVLHIHCDRATQKLTIKASSAMRMPQDDRPRREVFVSFDGVEDSETWLWGDRGRAATLTRDFAIEPFLEKLAIAKTLDITVAPNDRAQVHFHFAAAGARLALADLRAACSAPAPNVP
ncbi:MAG: hypothetical protein ACOYJ6_04725 [Caulobacterales bacterium]|jgi:hypothetical protein